MNPLELQPTALPLLLMSIAAPSGAVDVIGFHLWRFRLYSAPSSRAETVTHLVRGATFAATAYLLATYRVGGAWFWIVGFLFAFDFVNNVVDAVLEPRSRAAAGGIPPAEYVIHVIGSTFAGATTIAFFLTAWTNRHLPTALLAHDASIPAWLSLNGRVLAGMSTVLTLFELGLLLHSVAARTCAGTVKRTCCARQF
jgi:hypothetical protein